MILSFPQRSLYRCSLTKISRQRADPTTVATVVSHSLSTRILARKRSLTQPVRHLRRPLAVAGLLTLSSMASQDLQVKEKLLYRSLTEFRAFNHKQL
jgi:hypothetical protein